MKVICIGTLDKYSRFYINLCRELNSNNRVKSYIYSIHFSGFLYTFLRFKFSCWISTKTWMIALRNKKKYTEVLSTQDYYKTINFKQLIKFHLKLNKSLSEQKLALQALAYIDFFDNLFLTKNPDLVVLVGDSKLSIEICTAIAKKYNVKTYFIEQGPFSTTVFDSKGVNANSSVRDFKNYDSYAVKGKDISAFINRKRPKSYNRSPFYRGFDFILDYLFKKSILYPPDLKYTDTFPSYKSNKTSKKHIFKLNNSNAKIYLLILQIPMDVNMIYHSPHFDNHKNIVKKIHKNLPENSKLILREHPLYKGKYEFKLYKYCEKHHIDFDTGASLKKSLNIADVVIVNNSTVGIEAIAMNKTVVVLGNSYYDNPRLCIKYKQQDDLKLILKNALGFKPNKKDIDIFLNEFLFNYLVEGFITDKDLIAAKTISNKLKALLN